MKNKRELRASIKAELAYHEGKNILIKRFPSEIEIKEFHNSPHKLIDEQQRIIKNEILVLMYERRDGISFVDVNTGGIIKIKEDNPFGIDIEIHMKQPDTELRVDLGEIARELCKKHLKPAFILPSQYSISCKIDKIKLIDEKARFFCTDFLNELRSKIESFTITKQEKTIITPSIKDIDDGIISSEQITTISDDLNIKIKNRSLNKSVENANIELFKIDNNFYNNPLKFSVSTDKEGKIYLNKVSGLLKGLYLLRISTDNWISPDKIVDLELEKSFILYLNFSNKTPYDSSEIENKNKITKKEIERIISKDSPPYSNYENNKLTLWEKILRIFKKRKMESIKQYHPTKKPDDLECPNCAGKDIIEIVYGYSPPLGKHYTKTGKLYGHGCVISDNSPLWHCDTCDFEFGLVKNR